MRQPVADGGADLIILQVKHGDPGVLVQVSNLAPPSVLEVDDVVDGWFDIPAKLPVDYSVDHLVGHDGEAVLIDGVFLERRARSSLEIGELRPRGRHLRACRTARTVQKLPGTTKNITSVT